jgi:serine protease
MDGCQAVSSVGKAGKLAFYSSYGTNGNGLFITAPGGDQRADGQEGGVWQNTIKTGDPTKHGYFPFQGTSMATPHVAGVAALVVSALPTEYTLDQVKDAMSSSATAMNDRAKYGSGLLNAEKAVSAAKNTDDSTGIPNPLEWFLGFLVLLGLVKAVRVSLSS